MTRTLVLALALAGAAVAACGQQRDVETEAPPTESAAAPQAAEAFSTEAMSLAPEGLPGDNAARAPDPAKGE